MPERHFPRSRLVSLREASSSRLTVVSMPERHFPRSRLGMEVGEMRILVFVSMPERHFPRSRPMSLWATNPSTPTVSMPERHFPRSRLSPSFGAAEPGKAVFQCPNGISPGLDPIRRRSRLLKHRLLFQCPNGISPGLDL